MTEFYPDVIAKYEALHSMPNDELVNALFARWDELNDTCFDEGPCDDCRAEMLPDCDADEYARLESVWGRYPEWMWDYCEYMSDPANIH